MLQGLRGGDSLNKASGLSQAAPIPLSSLRRRGAPHLQQHQLLPLHGCGGVGWWRPCRARLLSDAVMSEARGGADDALDEVTVPFEEIAYTVTIVESCRRNDVTGALFWMREMRSSPFKPNVYVFNSLISMFSKKSDSRSARNWFAEMEKTEGVTPTTLSYNAVIDSFRRERKPREAEMWFELLENSGNVPDKRSCISVLYSFAMNADLDGAMRWWKRTCAAGCADDFAYSLVFSCLAKQEQSSERDKQVEDLLRHMRFTDCHPSERTLEHVASSLGKDRQEELCRDLRIQRQWAQRLDDWRTKASKNRSPGTQGATR